MLELRNESIFEHLVFSKNSTYSYRDTRIHRSRIAVCRVAVPLCPPTSVSSCPVRTPVFCSIRSSSRPPEIKRVRDWPDPPSIWNIFFFLPSESKYSIEIKSRRTSFEKRSERGESLSGIRVSKFVRFASAFEFNFRKISSKLSVGWVLQT